MGGDHPGDQAQEPPKLPLAGEPVGLLLRAEGRMVGGVPLEAVLDLRRVGRLRDVQHPVRGRDLCPVAQGQVPGDQGLEVDYGPAAVGKHVEILHGDPVPVIQHPKAAAAHFPLGHEGQGVGVVLLDGGRRLDLLEIVPEQTSLEAQVEGGKPGHELVHRPLQKGRVHVLPERDGLAEHVVPVFAADGREDQRRVVERHPYPAMRIAHMHASPSQK